jgi:uncharacterized damage-inducible protein DinB
MSNPLASAILITWRRNAAYALRLVGDLSDAQFTAQPISGRTLNHPAWVLSHLTLYTAIAAAMLREQPFADPADHIHGAKSEPTSDAAAYSTRSRLIEQFRSAHDDAEAALIAAGDGIFASPNPLERWRTLHPTTGDMLVTLMVKHEAAHLGQLSAWRRAMGLPRVAM